MYERILIPTDWSSWGPTVGQVWTAL